VSQSFPSPETGRSGLSRLGLTKSSLIDYPGRVAAVLFTWLLRAETAWWAGGLHKALMCLAVAALWVTLAT